MGLGIESFTYFSPLSKNNRIRHLLPYIEIDKRHYALYSPLFTNQTGDNITFSAFPKDCISFNVPLKNYLQRNDKVTEYTYVSFT